MAFVLLDPSVDRIQLSTPTIQMGPSGPIAPFDGPHDWVNYTYSPSVHSPVSNASDGSRHEALNRLMAPYGLSFPLAADANGRPGWDPDWTLLMVLTHDDIPLRAFRDVLAQSDPCVAHPSPAGPGGGKPLPFAILASRQSPQVQMRLLDCLPREALTRSYRGQTLAEAMVNEKGAPKGPCQWVLLAWLMRVTHRPCPFAVADCPPASLTKLRQSASGHERQNLTEMMRSTVIRLSFSDSLPTSTRWDESSGEAAISRFLLCSARECRAKQNPGPSWVRTRPRP